jgi:prepilin-type N-terminal cleavage/methylation domain-containing protein
MKSTYRNGMTLLEVVVALAVAGAALAAGASALGFLTDQQNRMGAQAITSAHAVRTTLRDWISDAQLTTQGDAEFLGTPGGRMTLDAEHDELSFVTTAPTQIGTLGAKVRLYIARGERDSLRGLVAELKPWRFEGAPTIVSLAPSATGLQLRYLASLDGPHVWQASWASTSVLPAAVELRVKFDSLPSNETIDRAAQSLVGIPMTIALARK